MTKEEFANIINIELEKAQEKYKEAKRIVTYFEKIGDIGLGLENKELESAKYQYDLYNSRIIMLCELLNFPALARIQAMSDAEIDRYKEQKIDELNSKILENNLLLEKEREIYEGLLNEQTVNIDKFENASKQEQEKLIERGREIRQALIQYESPFDWGIFMLYEGILTKLEEEKQDIMNKSSQKIKDEICSKIEKFDYFKEELEHEAKFGISTSSRLIASVANEPKKALQMANLLEKYSRIYRKKEMCSKHLIKISANLPKTFIESLNKEYILDRKDLDIYVDESNIEEFEREVIIAEEKFLYEKERLSKEYTYEKLKHFQLERDYEGINEVVNPEFIEQHKDKIKESTLIYLNSYLKDKERPTKKLFFLINPSEKHLTDAAIKDYKDDIYRQVENWYQIQCYAVMGPNRRFQSYGDWDSREAKRYIKNDISRFEETIAVSELLFTSLKQVLQDAKEKINLEKKNRNEVLDQLSTQIRSLAGKEFENIEVKIEPELEEVPKFQVISRARELEAQKSIQESGPKLQNDPLVEKSASSQIIEASNSVFKSEIINRIQEEATKQSENEEAEIKGISLDKLKKLKEELKSNLVLQTSVIEESTPDSINDPSGLSKGL